MKKLCACMAALGAVSAGEASSQNVIGVYPMPSGSATDEAVLSTADSSSQEAWVVQMMKDFKLGGESPGAAPTTTTPAPQLVLPGGLTAAQWDEHATAVTAGRRVVAPTPFPSHAPTPKPYMEGRNTANFGDFKYVDGRVVLICPAGQRHEGTAHVLRGNAGFGRCTECGGGRYQPKEDQSACHVCPAGKFNVHRANVDCTACPAGEYQPEPGMTYCLDERLRGKGRFDADGRLQGQVAKAHYSPRAALQCCASKCPTLTLSGAERADPLWQVKNRGHWAAGQPLFVAPPAQVAREDCDTGCRLWMRHSSLNWDGSHWRLGLLDRCNKDCEQAERTHWHMWTEGHKGVASKGACMKGCKDYFDCMFAQDKVFAALPNLLKP